MKNILSTKTLLTLFAAITIACRISSPCAASEQKGNLDKINGITVLTLQGTPYEMGFQHGSLLKEDIRKIYKIYLTDMVYNKWTKEYSILGKGGPKAYSNPRGALLAFAKKSEKYIPPELIEEMKGLADGAGLKYEDVLILSSHIDYFAVLCSTFVARGPYTKDGKLIEGRNLDWAQGGLKELDAYSAVIVYKPDKGHAFISIGYPGIVGVLTSVNDAGIVAELNFSMATETENDSEGFPALALMRKLIADSGSIAEAQSFLEKAKRMAGYNIVVVDTAKRDAAIIEISAKNMGVVPIKDDAFVSTNHFISKELEGKNTKASGFSSSPSSERFAILSKLVQQNKGKIDPDAARAMMHAENLKVPGTVQTVVFSPETHEFWFWSRNRAPGDFVHFDVNELFGR